MCGKNSDNLPNIRHKMAMAEYRMYPATTERSSDTSNYIRLHRSNQAEFYNSFCSRFIPYHTVSLTILAAEF